MHRASHALSTAARTRVLVRIARRRLTTTAESAPAPKKKRRVFRNVVLTTVSVATGFFIGSTFLAFNNQRYHDFFTEHVPFGRAFIEFGQVRNWDTLTAKQVYESGKKAASDLQRFISSKLGGSVPPTTTPETTPETAPKKEPSPPSTLQVLQERHKQHQQQHQQSADRLKSVASALKTSVERTEHDLSDRGKKALAIARHQSSQFTEGVDDLIRKAEAVSSTAAAVLPEAAEKTEPKADPDPPEPSPAASQPLPVPIISTSSSEPTSPPPKAPTDKPAYTSPLPIGFEPPPGYSAPKPFKRDLVIPPRRAEPRLRPLPQVTQAVAQFGASDPVIVQLASYIDNLASYLNSNPVTSVKARAAVESAKSDLTELATRLEKTKEEGQALLERKHDDQTKEYTLRLLELEMEARDKINALKEEGPDIERAQFQQEFRKKVDEELHRQAEQINEQFKEQVTVEGIAMQQRWILDLKDRMEHERSKRLAKLDELSADVKRLERAVFDNSAHLDESTRLNELWKAIRALNTAVEAPVRRPFREELRTLKAATAAREDPVISAALESLDGSEVPDVGVEPLSDLTTWFTISVAPQVSDVALVPDENAGVISHLASSFLSSLRFQRRGLAPGTDVLSVLARAEYYLNGKDLDSAARELNQLRGTAKVLLSDWLDAARQRLEVLHALEVIETQATLATEPVATSQ